MEEAGIAGRGARVIPAIRRAIYAANWLANLGPNQRHGTTVPRTIFADAIQPTTTSLLRKNNWASQKFPLVKDRKRCNAGVGRAPKVSYIFGFSLLRPRHRSVKLFTTIPLYYRAQRHNLRQCLDRALVAQGIGHAQNTALSRIGLASGDENVHALRMACQFLHLDRHHVRAA